jgi:hypothetical protein
VDANGLFIARLILKTNADEIVRLKHLGRRLHKPTLVPVEGLQRDKAGQGTGEQGQKDQNMGPPAFAEEVEEV